MHADDVRCAAVNHYFLVRLDLLRDFPKESREELRQVSASNRRRGRMSLPPSLLKVINQVIKQLLL